MKTKVVILLMVCLVLPGCHSAGLQTVKPSPTPFVCNEPGAVTTQTLAETTRGYAYQYAVYLPPCYESNSEQKYPVLYLVPGRGGSASSWFAAGANRVADDLISSSRVPPFLIVATEDTDADPQAETIFNDLLPHITTSYRILPDRQHHAVAGGSLGGIAAYRLLFQHPEQFASAGIFGSGLIHGEEAQFQNWLQALPPKNLPRVFLNCGEQDPLMLPRAQVMIEMLEEAGIETTSLFTPGEHNYGYWVSNLAIYFQWLAQDW